MKVLVGYLVGMAFYIGLAALPYGGFGPFLSHPARLATTIVMVVATVAAAFSGSSGLSGGVQEDRGNRWVFVPIAILSVVNLFAPPWSDAHDVLVFGGDAARYSGVVVLTIGVIVRIWPVFVLGWRFSGVVAIQPGHTLETGGIYAHLRHPSYLGLLLSMIGWSLVFRSLLGLWCVPFMLAVLVSRMNAEEKLMGQHFGEAYEVYRKRTWRLVPYVY